MGIQDFIVTPFYIFFLTIIAYFIRPYVTNKQTRKYFMPALWVRFGGALALGIVYQFYYGGGDTFNYWTNGSKWIWEAFIDNPINGWRLFIKQGPQHLPDLYKYSQHIWYYRDPSSFFIIRIAFLFDLITFHTYSATSLFFAVFSFSGAWALFTALQKKYSERVRLLAFVTLFFPSVIFWGSGILKDTITIGALCWMAWSLIRMIDFKLRGITELVVFALSLIVILKVKIYILICFLPMLSIWLYFKYLAKIKSKFFKYSFSPILILIFATAGYAALLQITRDNSKYQLDSIAQSARITAYDIRYGWGARTGGDGGYDIGLPDGSWQSMLALAPQAINVSLFRPYLWEVKNPLMLLSSLESLLVLFMFIRFFVFGGGWTKMIKDPFLIFCLGFSLVFAFAVGISTFNFGTLMRYKIPMMPFLLVLLVSLYKRSNVKTLG